MKKLYISNTSDAVIIVIHEIYRINEHMKHISQSLAAPNFDELISTLVNKNTEIYKRTREHGFADPYSVKYHPVSAEKAFDELVRFITQ